MQNSSGLDSKRFLDQTLYTYKYISEKLSNLEEVKPNVNTSMTEKEKNFKTVKLGMVTRLRPVVEYIGISEVIIGIVLMILLVLYACDYDKLYATENSRQISLMTFGGLVFLIFNGMMLLTSLKFNQKKVMWSYILVSTILWVYLFVLSVIEIHFALLVIERDPYKVVLPQRLFFLSNACVLGVASMLGSVTHFIGNVAVFSYYNLKYIQPMLFSCGP